jgi:hypothetical protein
VDQRWRCQHGPLSCKCKIQEVQELYYLSDLERRARLTSHVDKEAEFTEFYERLLGTREVREVTIDLDALKVPSFELS